MKSSTTSRFLRFHPTSETLLVFLTTIIIPILSSTPSLETNQPDLHLYLLIHALSVALPAIYVLLIQRQPPHRLGFTFEHDRSLYLGLFATVLLSLYDAMQTRYIYLQDHDFLPHVIFSILTVGRPFFVHCWVQIRFVDAFGGFLGVILTGLVCAGCQVVCHVMLEGGHVMWEDAVGVGVKTCVLGFVFGVCGNDFMAVWPVSWSVLYVVSGLKEGKKMTYSSVYPFVCVSVFQATTLASLFIRRHVIVYEN